MCNSPWTDRDMFVYVSDCHIYEPFLLLICSLIIVVGALCVGVGVYEFHRRKRKTIPASTIAIGVFFCLPYLLIVSMKITFADRNIALNLLHAFGRNFVWITVGVHVFRHLEVLMHVDQHTVAQSVHFHQFLTNVQYGMFGFNTVLEVTFMLIPTLITHFDLIHWVASTSIVLMVMNTLPRIIYGWKLREIIRGIKETNLQFYTPVEAQLTQLINGTIISTIIGLIIVFCWGFIPVLRLNMYIIYNIQMLIGPLSGIYGLWETRLDTVDAGREKHGGGSSAAKTECGSMNESRKQQQSLKSQSSPRLVPEDPHFPSHPEQQLPHQILIDNRSHQEELREDEQQTTGLTPMWNPFTHSTSTSNPLSSSTTTSTDGSGTTDISGSERGN